MEAGWVVRSVVLLALTLMPCAVGCERLVLRSQVTGSVETRLDTPPVSLSAGNVRPVVVQSGPSRIAIVDVDGLILNTPFVGPLSCGENPVALFREKLEAVACDPCVKAVVLRINSPGGGVAQFNVIPQSIKAGDLTDIGTSARALTEGEKAILQAMADEFHKQLIADVKRTRPAITNNNAFDGRIFTGSQAKAIGLVDQTGDLDEAIQLA